MESWRGGESVCGVFREEGKFLLRNIQVILLTEKSRVVVKMACLVGFVLK